MRRDHAGHISSKLPEVILHCPGHHQCAVNALHKEPGEHRVSEPFLVGHHIIENGDDPGVPVTPYKPGNEPQRRGEERKPVPHYYKVRPGASETKPDIKPVQRIDRVNGSCNRNPLRGVPMVILCLPREEKRGVLKFECIYCSSITFLKQLLCQLLVVGGYPATVRMGGAADDDPHHGFSPSGHTQPVRFPYCGSILPPKVIVAR